MSYTVVDLDTYYRKGVFKHFKDDCKCSLSITARIDVTKLVEYSKKTDTKFYINFLYLYLRCLIVVTTINTVGCGRRNSWYFLIQSIPSNMFSMKILRLVLVCILIIIRTILSFMRKLWRIWKKLRKATNTHWKQRVIQTGLMHPLYLGSAMIA